MTSLPKRLAAWCLAALTCLLLTGATTVVVFVQPATPIAWVGAAVTQNIGNVSPTINYPTVVANDIMLCVFASGTTNTYPGTPPTGWTKLNSQNDGASDSSGAVFWKRAGASEPASEEWTDIFNAADGEHGQIIVVAYRNCKASGSPINTSAVTSSTAGTEKTVGTVTPTVSGCMLVAIMTCDPTATSEFTFDAGPTTRINRASTPTGVESGNNGLIDIAEYLQSTAAEITFAGDYNEDEAASHFVYALEPTS